MNKNVSVDLDEILDALEMTSMTDEHFSRSFVNTQTGQVVTLFEGEDFSDVEDEDLEGDWIPEHYASLPMKDELDEYDMMDTFCRSITDKEIQEDLLDAIQGRGAFKRFKETIHEHHIAKDWYEFRNERLIEIAVEFCKHHGLAYK